MPTRARRDSLNDAVTLLRAEREAQGVSLADLAERTGIAKSNLSRLENQHHTNPTIATLVKIAGALDHHLEISLTKDRTTLSTSLRD